MYKYFELNFKSVIFYKLLPKTKNIFYSFKASLVLVVISACLWAESWESAVWCGNRILPLFGFQTISGSSAESLSLSPDGKLKPGGLGAGDVSLFVFRLCTLKQGPLCLMRFAEPSFDLPLSSSSLLPSVHNSSPDIHWSSSSCSIKKIIKLEKSLLL